MLSIEFSANLPSINEKPENINIIEKATNPYLETISYGVEFGKIQLLYE